MHPNLLADMARTVDHISGGRFIFGIGAGWFRREYDEYGYEFGTAPVTLRITAQYADIWNGLGEPDVARHKCEVLDRHCRRVGREPDAIERSIGGINRGRLSMLDDYVAAGVTHFIMGVEGPTWDLSLLSDLVAYRDERNGATGGSRAAR